MRNPQGYATIVGPGTPAKEIDTFTCKHCNTIVHVKALSDPSESGGFCRICWGLICKFCVAEGTCKTWEARMEEMEARDRFRQSAGLKE